MFETESSEFLRSMRSGAAGIAAFVFLQGSIFLWYVPFIGTVRWTLIWCGFSTVAFALVSVGYAAILRQRTRANRASALRGKPQRCPTCNGPISLT
jgi:hypothetical protein